MLKYEYLTHLPKLHVSKYVSSRLMLLSKGKAGPAVWLNWLSFVPYVRRSPVHFMVRPHA